MSEEKRPDFGLVVIFMVSYGDITAHFGRM